MPATAMDMTVVQSEAMAENRQSEIQSFYNDATVFLTGATGFLGTMILEKLMRTCSIKRIYILIREKKGKTPEERFKDLFNNSVFELMKKQTPNYLEKISAVIGDCGLPEMGIGEQYQEILKNEVNVIIHSAATVRFDEHLRLAMNINVVGLQYLLKMCKDMKNLKSFVHISTAYSQCSIRKEIDEVFYEPPLTGDQLVQIVNNLDDEYIKILTPSLLKEFPNTYTFTKAIAESEVLTMGKGLPVGMIRPSMIIGTESEPVPGWINNYYGPTGITAAAGIGLLRVMLADPNAIAEIIPGDFVSNAVLSCAWDIHNKWIEHKKTVNGNVFDRDSYTPSIYNLVSSNMNQLKWREFVSINKCHGTKIPIDKMIWPIMLKLTPNKYLYTVLCFLLHTLPAYVLDSLAKLVGKRPRLMKEYEKLHKYTDILKYFALNSWKWNEPNTQALISRMSKEDRTLFNFDISLISWDDYFFNSVRGIRKYIFREESLDTVPQGLKHVKRLYMIYYTLIAFLVAFALLIIYLLFLLFN
ncbi:Male sterility, NAD-binding,NAD(P)-binding domain,Fatty acyl-CoA reductase, C-terminal [Cinara cedri]|uniref:Fatty acyl-CoA reductase n=1 Tax=Cinara cedri TaxID=506608 RepID=A0A5E4MCC8_9HEMI|nr:Male sterility, NAD-binding,NAD(P)-binding domain,Fatty acyl-CoA reductase, C-terminal [Cinara cedri]